MDPDSEPMAATTDPLSPLYKPDSRRSGPERAVMLQRYMVLHHQRGTIQRRMSIASSSASSPSVSPRSSIDMSTSSETSSTASSPTLTAISTSQQTSLPTYSLPKPATATLRKASSTMSSIPEDATLSDEQIFHFSGEPQDESRLCDVNLQIKSTLTDLLNCEAVRRDEKMRMWAMSRLMDAELELKRQRRRRVSVPAIAVGAHGSE